MRGVRHTSEADRELIQRWIEADPDHRGKTSADFFLPPLIQPGELISQPSDGALIQQLCFMERERPVFFARCSTIMRLDTQFDVHSRFRTAAMLGPGMAWLLDRAKVAGFRQVIFESTYRPLIAFATDRLGFRESPNEFVREVG